MMDKVTSDDAAISETSGIFNKLPSWLVEMTESVKKLKAPEEKIDFLSTKNFASDKVRINSKILSTNFGVTEKDDRTDDVPFGLPFVVQAPDDVGRCIILQPSATTSLPNTPKGGYEFSRGFSALSAFSLPDSNEDEVMTSNKYLDKEDIERSTDLDCGTKYPNKMYSSSESKSSESQHAWSCTMLWKKPIEELESNQLSVDIHTEKGRRISQHQQQSTGKPPRIRVPPYRGTSNQSQSTEKNMGSNLPIGIIKRKQDYLAGVASRDDIEMKSTDLPWDKNKTNVRNQLRIETPGSGHVSVSMGKNVGDFEITDKVAQLNLQTSRKPDVTEIIKKSEQTDSSQAENDFHLLSFHGEQPVYHYQRYSPKVIA